MQARDTLDGISEIYEAGDKCLKQFCLPIEKPFVFIITQCLGKSAAGIEKVG